MTELLKCGKVPCKSCPYRKDVPSGIWDVTEYAKLIEYDGSTFEQLLKGGSGLFMCHQQNGKLCSGWVGTHDTQHLLAFRLHHAQLDPSVWSYKSPVPLFKSGAEAADHGMKNIDAPGVRAQLTIYRILKKRLDGK
jgi:hypothetical protein